MHTQLNASVTRASNQARFGITATYLDSGPVVYSATNPVYPSMSMVIPTQVSMKRVGGWVERAGWTREGSVDVRGEVGWERRGWMREGMEGSRG